MSGDTNADALTLLANDLERVADTCRAMDRRDIAVRLARASRQLARIADGERRPRLIAPIWSMPAGASRHI